jgi:hypothetical protein
VNLLTVNRDEIYKKMFNYLEKGNQENLLLNAFNDIGEVFLSFYDEYNTQLTQFRNDEEQNEKVTWVCNASMGHGKTSVLISFLKLLVSENNPRSRVPVLLVIRENGMAEQIEEEMKVFRKNCILRLDARNKDSIEQYMPYHQIVIITHSRLDNLALGYGNIKKYKIWKQYPMNDFMSKEFNEENIINERHRLTIVDEKPSFINASVFDIGSKDNSLDWFDDLSPVLGLKGNQLQSIRSHITTLIAYQLSENITSVTTALIPTDEKKASRSKNLIRTIKNMKNSNENFGKMESLKKLRHFEELLFNDGKARIDDYSVYGTAGRKIIMSERIDYKKIGMNILCLDGTSSLNHIQYKSFTLKPVKNYNNYSRLYLHQERINTSKDSRSKKGNPTQVAISKRIKELHGFHNKMFVLPVKSDIDIYKRLECILEEFKGSFEETGDDNTKPINLLNTTGKNIIKDVTALFLTSMPRMYADYYKKIAIALYGNDVSLEMDEDDDSICWFKDKKLELIYRNEMYAELLQIIHRSALRKIKESTEINVYIAFDDSQGSDIMQFMQPTLSEIDRWYLNEAAHISDHEIHDESKYGRGEVIRGFLTEIDSWINKNETFFTQLPLQLSKIDKSKGGVGERFREWLKKNWKNRGEMINEIFAEKGYIIYEEGDKKIKHITTLSKYNDAIIWGDGA